MNFIIDVFIFTVIYGLAQLLASSAPEYVPTIFWFAGITATSITTARRRLA